MQDYTEDSTLNLLRRAEFSGIASTDNEEGECGVYRAVRGAVDRSTFSMELARAVTDWPSQYHLDRRRHCLIRPLAIRPGDTVLELGCGGGAVTRFLGEIGAQVTAVEAGLQRARIASERCLNLRNVRIVLEDIPAFRSDERFDWVLLLDFSGQPHGAGRPAPVALISMASRFLKPTGTLVVAIENKLGLKYFNGCAEDHVRVPFYGLQGLYAPHAQWTLGRRELAAHLAAIGLRHTRFYYPFPDHTLPTVILSDEALSDSQFDPTDLLASSHSRDCTGSSYRHFDDALTLVQVARNGLLGDLSHCFLVAASNRPHPHQEQGELAVKYAVDRFPEFVNQTRFVRTGDQIKVLKEALQPGLPRRKEFKQGFLIENVLGHSDYVPGQLLLWRLLRARADSGELSEVVDALKPWFDLLLGYANDGAGTPGRANGRKQLADYTLQGSHLDLTPYNVMDTGTELVVIDTEWKLDGIIPLGWVVTRSVNHALRIGVPLRNPIGASSDVIKALCSVHNIDVSDSDIAGWLQWEAELQAVAAGEEHQELVAPSTSSGLISLGDALDNRAKRIASLEQELVNRDQQFERLADESIERNLQIATHARTIADLERRIHHMRGTVAARDRHVAELVRALSSSTAADHTDTPRDVPTGEATSCGGKEDRSIAALSTTLALRDGEIAELRAQQLTHGAKLAELRRTVAERGEKIKRLTEDLARCDGQIDALNGALAQHRAELAEEKEMRDRLARNQIDALNGALAQHRAELAEEKEMRDRLARNQIDALNGALAQHRAELAEEKEMRDRLARKIVALHASTSWRATSALRVAGRLVRRLRAKGA